ncbi:TPA_asm: hypothetical protein vir519_00017 [Caudoviricetes sp. vir519]|nr:TPA_asm: hypothetical protein vir519_00017 [Caudoviricetes sp. vir519]
MIWCVICDWETRIRDFIPLNRMEAIEKGWLFCSVETAQGPWGFFLCPQHSNRKEEAAALMKRKLNHKHSQVVLSEHLTWETKVYSQEQCSVCSSERWDCCQFDRQEQTKIEDYL